MSDTSNTERTIEAKRGLIALNAALAAILAAVTLIPTATGGQPDSRGRGEYIVVGTKYVGSSSSALLILDGQNQELVALGWDESRGQFNPLGYRNLVEDARLPTEAAPGGGRK